jgi:DNA-binding NtrC family response regulator
VLLVDDDDEVVRGYQHALLARGYAVDMACDEQAAVRLACEKRFDVIVGDTDMRGLRGCELLLDLRKRRRDLPLVLLSSGVAFASARVALACGAYRYLLKPVTEGRLVEVVVATIRENAVALGSSWPAGHGREPPPSS